MNERSSDGRESGTPQSVSDSGDHDFQRVIDGMCEFAFDCYQGLITADPGENHLYSPSSLSLAMVMAYAGARGETREHIRDVFHFPDDEDALHEAYEHLQTEFTQGHNDEISPSRKYDEEDEPMPFELSIVNALWEQAGYPFRDDYLSVLAEHYDGGLRVIDFEGGPTEARETINRWVADETGDRIGEILPERSLSALTRFVIVNAVYFRGNWKDPFLESRTTSEEFTALDGEPSKVPMMQDKRTWRYAAVDDAEAVELPYVDDRTGMIVILPPEGEFEAYERNLDAQTFAAICDSLSDRFGLVRLPRFEFNSKSKLKETFRAMGMEAAFDETAADFRAMVDTEEPLAIDQVYHDASIDVDETGTEAAAATSVVVMGIGADFTHDEIEFVANRPFLFVIRDQMTGTPLFVGRVVDPVDWQ